MAKCNSCEKNLKAGEADVCYKCSIKLVQQLKADAPLMSEALMYAEFHRSSASKENIVNTMCDFFNGDELKTAKTLLYNRFGSLNILQHSADRLTTENRTDLMVLCCDIVDDLFKLEESNISVLCGAANWKRLPKMNPEEITNVSMADKLAQFEAKLAQYDIAIADVKRTNFAIDARVSNMENSRNAEWPNIISTVVPDKNGKRVTRDDNPFTMLNRDATDSEPSGTSGNGPRHVEYKRHARVGNDRRNDSTSDNSSGRRGNYRRNGSNSDVSYDGRRTGTGTSRGRFAYGGGRESGRRHLHGGIMGKSTDGGLSGGPPPRRDFFVYRLMKDSGEEDLRNFMMSKNIEPHDIAAKNVPDARFNPFKVSVSLDNAEKMWDLDMWPVGVCVKRWVKFEH